MKYSKKSILLNNYNISLSLGRVFILILSFVLLFLYQSLDIMLPAVIAQDPPPAGEEKYAQLNTVQAPLNYPEGTQVIMEHIPGGVQGKISLDLRNIDVVDALKFLSMKAGMNIITTKSVTGRITLMVENVLIKDVFDIMLRSNNLAYDKKGEIYNVMSQKEYLELYGTDFADVRQVAVFRLKYTAPEQAFSLLDLLKSEIGRVLVDTESGNVLIMDSPDKIEVMKQALDGFEKKNLVKVVKLNYALAKDIEDQLKSQLNVKKVGLIKADERSNQVIIQTLPERMEEILELINILDQKTKEILIDARIVKVKLSDDLSTGIEWEGLFDLGLSSGLGYLGSYPFSAVQEDTDAWRSRKQVFEDVAHVGSYPFTGTSVDYSAGKSSIGAEEMHIGMVTNKKDFDMIIKFLNTIGETRVLSNPKIAVVNNQEAKIHVGEEIPYVISTTVGAGETTASVAEEVKFEEIGILLSVVPNINYEGYVTLKVKAEISSLLDFYITPTDNKIPIKDTSTSETTVMVKDGSTIVIGGLRKEEEYDSLIGVPFLSKIPFLGRIFSTRTQTKTRTELLIILTPKLITGDVLLADAMETNIGKEGIKSLKDYSGLKSEVFVPLDEEGLVPKGFRAHKKR